MKKRLDELGPRIRVLKMSKSYLVWNGNNQTF